MIHSLNVLLTTIGRPELKVRMLPSLVNQLNSNDYLTIISDANHKYVGECIQEFKFKCTVIHIMNPTTLGAWGHNSRNAYQNRIVGDYIMNADDDDRYVDGAFDKIREVVKERKLYLFKHQNKNNFAWSTPNIITIGNVGTSCGVIPNTGNLPKWEDFYGGDGRFYENLSRMLPTEFVDFVIYKVNDTE